MFSEILNQKPMREWLTGEQGLWCPEAGDPAWNTVPSKFRMEIAALAEIYREKPYPMRSATGFLDFVRTGSRKADEEPYFFRRRKLCISALNCCMDEKVTLDDVLDGIWCICEETSWVISAHNVNPIPGAPIPADYPLPDPKKPYIDLFAAQTGMILAFVRRMLGKKLNTVSPVIDRRMANEIDQRILTHFMKNNDFWWMGFRRKDLCNWTPWIISNIMACAFLREMKKEKLEKLLDRACRILDVWLDTVPEDGGCDEGAGYWNMAGGSLLDCLEMLEKATGDKLVFWQEEKIRRILVFPEEAEIGRGWFMNFADCDARPFLSGERLQLAGEKLGDPALIAMGCEMRGTLAGQLKSVPHFNRAMSLLFHPQPETVRPVTGKKDVWLPDLQVRVVRRGKLTLCCKGGNNGENHNHNDVGSFMLYMDGEPEIIDAGNMVYTAKTFSDQRYTLWNVRSAYHNVPMIGGREQQAGTMFRARETEYLPDGLRMDLAETYGVASGVKSCRREIELDTEGLTVRDHIETETQEKTCWVFMFRNEPVKTKDGLETDRLQMNIPEGWKTEIEEIPITDSCMARNWPGSLWRVMITAQASCLQEAEWRFRRHLD